MKKWVIFLSVCAALCVTVIALQFTILIPTVKEYIRYKNAYKDYNGAEIIKMFNQYRNTIIKLSATIIVMLMFVSLATAISIIAISKDSIIKENLKRFCEDNKQKKLEKRQRKLEKAQAKVAQLQNDIQKDDE